MESKICIENPSNKALKANDIFISLLNFYGNNGLNITNLCVRMCVYARVHVCLSSPIYLTRSQFQLLYGWQWQPKDFLSQISLFSWMCNTYRDVLWSRWKNMVIYLYFIWILYGATYSVVVTCEYIHSLSVLNNGFYM